MTNWTYTLREKREPDGSWIIDVEVPPLYGGYGRDKMIHPGCKIAQTIPAHIVLQIMEAGKCQPA